MTKIHSVQLGIQAVWLVNIPTTLRMLLPATKGFMLILSGIINTISKWTIIWCTEKWQYPRACVGKLSNFAFLIILIWKVFKTLHRHVFYITGMLYLFEDRFHFASGHWVHSFLVYELRTVIFSLGTEYRFFIWNYACNLHSLKYLNGQLTLTQLSQRMYIHIIQLPATAVWSESTLRLIFTNHS